MADKQKALETAISQIEKNFGKGSIMRLGQNTAMNVEAISTGSVTLDAATGIGGLPRGRIIEIYGPESSGKTTLALHVVAEAQRMGGEAAFIDAEHALDPIYAANLGVDVDSLLVSQPDNGEQALEITEALTRSGAIDVIVVDSVAALVPRSEIEGDMGDSHVGLHARLMSQALRKLAGAISKSNTIIIFINQLREKVGVVYGNPEVTTGGRALKFYASIRIDVRKIEQLKGPGNEFIGSRTRAKIVKNKVAPPFKEAEFDIMYGKGISKVGEILDLAVKYDIIHKSGAWFSYNENRLGQGRDNVKNYISEHPDFMAELEAQVRERLMAENNAARAAAKPAEKPAPAAEPTPAAMPKKPTSRSGAKAKLDIVVDDDDFVNNSTVMNGLADGTIMGKDDKPYESKILGGQNPLEMYCAGVANLDLSNICAYDQGCNEEFQHAMKNYFEGKASKDEALDLFYKAVTEKYPELTY